MAVDGEGRWSIGIWSGGSPLLLASPPRVRNPVLTRREVTDIRAGFVADPFMVRRPGGWSMFFEVLNEETGRGEIGLAESEDAMCWSYRRIVLREPFHLSYPCVVPWEGRFYMIPETLDAGGVRLYRAASFPGEWVHTATLIEGAHADPTLFHFADLWWLFTCPRPDRHDTLSLYWAEDLEGAWQEHPRSPIVRGDPGAARPGGRVVLWDGRPLRLAQDCRPRYGTAVRAFTITRLTPSAYAEEEVTASPILAPGGDAWNRSGMHHADPHPSPAGGWIACVDGQR